MLIGLNAKDPIPYLLLLPLTLMDIGWGLKQPARLHAKGLNMFPLRESAVTVSL